jgi:DNA-directed RNA polymerase subunit RPC12/RpoP
MALVSTPQRCPRCGSGAVHLDWHERVNAQEVQGLWRCWDCKNEFITVFASDEREPSETEKITERFFTSLLV